MSRLVVLVAVLLTSTSANAVNYADPCFVFGVKVTDCAETLRGEEQRRRIQEQAEARCQASPECQRNRPYSTAPSRIDSIEDRLDAIEQKEE
jgi:hypothetical protein